MCGLPRSGKSIFAKALAKQLDCKLLSPADWMDTTIQPGTQRFNDYAIACWRTALDLLVAGIGNGEAGNWLLDCGNSKFRTVEHIIRQAREYDHQVWLVIMRSRAAICRQRDGWPGDDVGRRYVESLRESVPQYKAACDGIVVIDNESTEESLLAQVGATIKRLCRTT